MASKHDPVTWIQSTFGISLHHKTANEYAGPCPWCGGTDRFLVWRDSQNFMCRPGPGHCGRKGFVDELTGENGLQKLTEQERRLLLIERRQDELERRQNEQDKRIAALERMAKCTDHITYHDALTPELREYWWSEGMADATIDKYLLGYCTHCPTDKEDRPSFTIPVVNRGQLCNIRHRLVTTENGDKYRPHMAGLGSVLFNVDLLDRASDSIIITEGEKKSVILAQSGFPNVGICGKNTFHREWLGWFDMVDVVYIALDPDATESAENLARLFDGRARVVDLPCKIDDMIVRHSAGANDIEAYLRCARPIR